MRYVYSSTLPRFTTANTRRESGVPTVYILFPFGVLLLFPVGNYFDFTSHPSSDTHGRTGRSLNFLSAVYYRIRNSRI